jgi:hypothetical protein
VKNVVNTVHNDVKGLTNFAGRNVNKVVDTGTGALGNLTSMPVLLIGGAAAAIGASFLLKK